MSALPPQAYPSAEVVPALDETRPVIGPNYAGDQELCRTVLSSLHLRAVYPQILQQQRLWPVWKRIDDAWRVKGEAYDLDISVADPQVMVTNPDAKGRGGLVDRKDGYSSRVYPSTLHKQINTKTDLAMSIAWSDGLPVRSVVPETVYEHPLYNPTQQGVDGMNEELRRCAREIKLKRLDRKGRGAFAKYGHAWAAVDFHYEQEVIPCQHPVTSDQDVALFAQQYGNQPPVNVQQTPDGRTVATWLKRVVKTMETRFTPLRVDDVFVDQTLPADNLDRQLCPCVRSRVNKLELFGNDYDPEKNPFGYLNCQQAMQDNGQQWTGTASDQTYQQELQKKWGLSMTGQIKPENAIKQKWTMYAMLAIDPHTGKLDEGSGVECSTCAGKGDVPAMVDGLDEAGQQVQYEHPTEKQTCPQCQGRKIIFLQPKRYVVEAYGNMEWSDSAATCLRIQELPSLRNKPPKVPLLYSCALSEDTAGAIPLCKAEASLKAVDQEATSLNQWFDAKNGLINPPWIIPEEADVRKDYNRPNGNIVHFGRPGDFVPMRILLDSTQNMMPFMQYQQNDVRQIMGANDTLLGEIQSGRRSASEIQTAYDASKVPVVMEIDTYNEDILEGWAQFHIDNIEAFGDRDWIRKKTGRETFGRLELFSAVADEFMKRQAAIGNLQYLAQFANARPDANIKPLVGAMAKLMKLPVNIDEVFPDGGVKKSIQDGMALVSQILGDGNLTPPDPSDPHEIYIEIFQQALRDKHWQTTTPETLPLLQQRLMWQTQLAMQQQQAQLAAQQQQIAMQQRAEGKGNGNQPAMSNKAPATVGGQNQQLMGASAPQ